jgi:hypothetical protein
MSTADQDSDSRGGTTTPHSAQYVEIDLSKVVVTIRFITANGAPGRLRTPRTDGGWFSPASMKPRRARVGPLPVSSFGRHLGRMPLQRDSICASLEGSFAVRGDDPSLDQVFDCPFVNLAAGMVEVDL